MSKVAVKVLKKKQTIEQTFDMIANHLIKQRQRSIDASGTCMYRDKETGHMCAIGCIIPDSLYMEGIEGNSFACLFTMGGTEGRIAEYIEKIHPGLLTFMKSDGGSLMEAKDLGCELQTFHDRVMAVRLSKKEMTRALRRIARAYGIKTSLPRI